MAELRPANLMEFFLYFFATFLYLPGPVMKAIDPSLLALKFSRKDKNVNECENAKRIHFLV